jgi:L-ascorbate metabolism protein UlaG (beta-lactamase superfamily)
MKDDIKCGKPNFKRTIGDFRPGPGELALWWLGQSGFAVKSDKTTLYLDPYLSTRLEQRTENDPVVRHVRMMSPIVDPSLISDADYIICSHNHGDHLDPDSVVPMMNSSLNAKLVIPPAAVLPSKEFGIQEERIVPVGAGDKVSLCGFDISAIPGKHNEFDYNAVTGYPYVGYILDFNGTRIYHAGDTVYYEELGKSLKNLDIDIALLPINGGDRDRVQRGFMSNLQFWEAADLAAELKVKLVIPSHYDMFTINTENVERFEYYMDRKYPDAKYIIPQAGRMILYKRS